ncbi:MAG: NAD(P)/FAD-dependent oxidoreductase [Solobacterium sp.]|nr:NAD(P)/FAD-dependent oxidoreductase [Solobacterium sp.]
MYYDAVIIGAGITGTMLAKDLSRYDLHVALLDKENDIANETTMANSAIVHTGYDPEDGTLKAELNVKGCRLYPQLCKDLDCLHKTVGAWIAAVGEEEEKHLDILADRAQRRDIPYAWLSGDEARELEPNLGDNVTKVLSFPTTAIIYPWEVAIACAEVAVNNGTELYLNTCVDHIEKTTYGYTVRAGEKTFETKTVIDAAGIFADEIAKMVTEDPGFEIRPRKGEYYVLDHDVEYTKHIIFPVPSDKGKGVLAVPTVHGNTLLGPNSDYVHGTVDTGSTVQGLDYVRENIKKTMKNVPYSHAIRTFAGLRPSSSSPDFIIRDCEDAPGFILAASIESPGLASAPAVSLYIIDLLKKYLSLKEKDGAVMTRKAQPVMKNLSVEERNEYIRRNPKYGHIVCRCEQISEGEIIDSLKGPCGATTIKGVKKRVRPGMGRCQGGFCEPLVLNILARELHKSPQEILLDGLHSGILEKENR